VDPIPPTNRNDSVAVVKSLTPPIKSARFVAQAGKFVSEAETTPPTDTSKRPLALTVPVMAVDPPSPF
jgi:hypothetical protein